MNFGSPINQTLLRLMNETKVINETIKNKTPVGFLVDPNTGFDYLIPIAFTIPILLIFGLIIYYLISEGGNDV
tara:strand:+ start:362 stop:580 length:219 start_codon:yes stop_codon:yes gene_type:complete